MSAWILIIMIFSSVGSPSVTVIPMPDKFNCELAAIDIMNMKLNNNDIDFQSRTYMKTKCIQRK